MKIINNKSCVIGAKVRKRTNNKRAFFNNVVCENRPLII